nr:hypothetical protein Iba_chr03aCG8920 [Ipomoea batatas]
MSGTLWYVAVHNGVWTFTTERLPPLSSIPSHCRPTSLAGSGVVVSRHPGRLLHRKWSSPDKTHVQSSSLHQKERRRRLFGVVPMPICSSDSPTEEKPTAITIAIARCRSPASSCLLVLLQSCRRGATDRGRGKEGRREPDSGAINPKFSELGSSSMALISTSRTLSEMMLDTVLLNNKLHASKSY